MASTKEMQARAKAKKQAAQTCNDLKEKYVDNKHSDWFCKVRAAINKASDWKSGYEATDMGVALIDAVVKRQADQGDKESFDDLMYGLVQFRFDTEEGLRVAYKLSNDGLRESKKSPDVVKYTLGVLDLVIGTMMMQGKIVTHMNVQPLWDAA